MATTLSLALAQSILGWIVAGTADSTPTIQVQVLWSGAFGIDLGFSKTHAGGHVESTAAVLVPNQAEDDTGYSTDPEFVGLGPDLGSLSLTGMGLDGSSRTAAANVR